MTHLATETDSRSRVTKLAAIIKKQRGRARVRFALTLAVLTISTIVLWLASLMFGDSFYSLADVTSVILGDTVPGASFTVGELRLPRATIAIVAGFAFGVSGIIFQTMLRNQLASPDIIGISAGAAAAGATMIVIFHASQAIVSTVALVASLSVAGLTYMLALKSGFTGTRLILTGIGIAAMLQAWTTYVLSKASAWDLPTATRWLTGSLNNMSWERGFPLVITVLVVVALLLVGAHRLSILELGDDIATFTRSPGKPAARSADCRCGHAHRRGDSRDRSNLVCRFHGGADRDASVFPRRESYCALGTDRRVLGACCRFSWTVSRRHAISGGRYYWRARCAVSGLSAY